MKYLMLLIFSSATFIATGQPNPVKWSFSSQKISDTELELIMTADIEDHWVVYSQFLESDEGPVATTFTFEPQAAYELQGLVKEDGKMKVGYDKLFEMELKKLSGLVTFRQRINVKGELSEVKGVLNFMCCDNERCLPPKDVNFVIPISL